MNRTRGLLLLGCAALLLFAIPGGHAQDGVDELSRDVESQDLDSYWADTSTWLSYGYRPHVTAPVHRFDSSALPSYFAGANSYSFGMSNLPSTSTVDPLSKTDIQLTKNGTWH